MKRLFLLATLCGALVGGASAHAAPDLPAQNLTLSPTKQQIDFTPGSTQKGTFHLLNAGKTGYDLKVYAKPYSVKNGEYQADFDNEKGNTDINKWISFDKTSFRLEPNQSVDVAYTITVPQNVGPGGRYGVIFAETLPIKDAKNAFGVSSTSRVGMLVLGTLTGKADMKGETMIQESSFFQFIPPMTARVSVLNNGNTHFESKVDMQVADFLGNVKHSSSKDYTVLPGTSRDMKLTWDQSPGMGLFKVKLSSTVLSKTKVSEHWVLMMPLWVYLVVAMLVLAGVMYAVLRYRVLAEDKSKVTR